MERRWDMLLQSDKFLAGFIAAIFFQCAYLIAEAKEIECPENWRRKLHRVLLKGIQRAFVIAHRGCIYRYGRGKGKCLARVHVLAVFLSQRLKSSKNSLC